LAREDWECKRKKKEPAVEFEGEELVVGEQMEWWAVPTLRLFPHFRRSSLSVSHLYGVLGKFPVFLTIKVNKMTYEFKLPTRQQEVVRLIALGDYSAVRDTIHQLGARLRRPR
jgi:hypothetical protein